LSETAIGAYILVIFTIKNSARHRNFDQPAWLKHADGRGI